jgi:hypothetical protein
MSVGVLLGWLALPLGSWQVLVTVPVSLLMGFAARCVIARLGGRNG